MGGRECGERRAWLQGPLKSIVVAMLESAARDRVRRTTISGQNAACRRAAPMLRIVQSPPKPPPRASRPLYSTHGPLGTPLTRPDRPIGGCSASSARVRLRHLGRPGPQRPHLPTGEPSRAPGGGLGGRPARPRPFNSNTAERRPRRRGGSGAGQRSLDSSSRKSCWGSRTLLLSQPACRACCFSVQQMGADCCKQQPPAGGGSTAATVDAAAPPAPELEAPEPPPQPHVASPPPPAAAASGGPMSLLLTELQAHTPREPPVPPEPLVLPELPAACLYAGAAEPGGNAPRRQVFIETTDVHGEHSWWLKAGALQRVSVGAWCSRSVPTGLALAGLPVPGGPPSAHSPAGRRPLRPPPLCLPSSPLQATAAPSACRCGPAPRSVASWSSSRARQASPRASSACCAASSG